MEEVMKKIIRIENDAKMVVHDAQQEALQKKLELDQRLKELEKTLIDQAHRKVVQLKEKEITLALQEAEQKKIECVSKLENIEKQYQRESEKWADMLVETVLKG